MTTRILFTLLLALAQPATAWEIQSAEGLQIETPAGVMGYRLNPANTRCEFVMNDRAVVQFDCQYAYPPLVLANARGDFGAASQVVVIQESPMGNACNGGPLHVLGIGEEQALIYHRRLNFCGGADPVIEASDFTLTISMPGGPVNRGEGETPTDVWVFADDRLSHYRP